MSHKTNYTDNENEQFKKKRNPKFDIIHASYIH